MQQPVTELDSRFSDEGAVASTWDDIRGLLESAELFWISTVRADGRPHVTPLVAVWIDGAIHFCCGDAEQKAINLRSNPHVLLTTGCNGWEGGVDVVVEGEAVRQTDRAVLERLAEAWGGKWDGRWKYEAGDGGFESEGNTALVFSVRPTKVLAFGKGKFSHTRYRFS